MNAAEERARQRWAKSPASAVVHGGSGGGGNDNFGERLAALEERVKHLATSEKLEQVRTEVEQVKTEVAKVSAEIVSLRWFLGILVGIFGILVSGILFKLFSFA